jgi:hypothetical protein
LLGDDFILTATAPAAEVMQPIHGFQSAVSVHTDTQIMCIVMRLKPRQHGAPDPVIVGGFNL